MPSKKPVTLDDCVEALATFTTSLLCGEANTTASFLFSAIVIKLSTWVAEPEGPAIIKLTSNSFLDH